jgi:hypothetical protein
MTTLTFTEMKTIRGGIHWGCFEMETIEKAICCLLGGIDC